MELASVHDCQTVAFPLISSGVYGYPKDQALQVAVDAIGSFLLTHDMTVYLVIFDRASYTIGGQLFADIAAYIDYRYAEEHTDSLQEQDRRAMAAASVSVKKEKPELPFRAASESLEEALNRLDESFSQMLLRKIDERGVTDAQCYKKPTLTASCSPRFGRTFITSHRSLLQWLLPLPGAAAGRSAGDA